MLKKILGNLLFVEANGVTTLTWTVVIQSAGFNAVVMKLLRPVLVWVFKGWLKKLAKLLGRCVESEVDHWEQPDDEAASR